MLFNGEEVLITDEFRVTLSDQMEFGLILHELT